MQTLYLLLAVTCIIMGGIGGTVGIFVRRYAKRWFRVLFYIGLAVSALPVMLHCYGTQSAGPKAITYMREHPERYSEQAIAAVQSALDQFTLSVLLGLLGLYLLCAFLARWRLWAGTALPAVAFVGYYHGAHGMLSDALYQHGDGDVLVTVMPDNMGMIWTFILSAGVQVGLFFYVWIVSRHGLVRSTKKLKLSALSLASSVWAVSEAGLLLVGLGSMARLSIAAILAASLHVGLFVYTWIVS